MPRIAITLTVAVLVIPLVATADTINGCVNQKNGKLRIVGVPGQCKTSETLVTWETEGGTQGPAGPAGAQGPQGQPGPPPPRFELVGFTGSFDGYEGVLGFTLSCQAAFPGSRMCISTEVVETVVVPLGLTGQAWVQPDFRVGTGTGSAVDAASGLTGLANELTCDGWDDGNFSLTVDDTGAFDALACTGFHPVACCAPAP